MLIKSYILILQWHYCQKGNALYCMHLFNNNNCIILSINKLHLCLKLKVQCVGFEHKTILVMFSVVCFILIVGSVVFITLEWALYMSILYIYIRSGSSLRRPPCFYSSPDWTN